MPDPTFNEVLTAAVEDLAANGFDSVERVNEWMRQLRAAAGRAFLPEAVLEQRLKDSLAAVYRRAVDQGGILKQNPGIARFTYEKLKPSLRVELDRRIMASANLIKLNRSAAVDKTLQRLSGWSTSIPPGGVSAETKREVKESVGKPFASLKFEERRVVIDQGHKLVSSISELVAQGGGAIAGRWRSHWRQPGYNYREDHKERDDQVYLLRDSWAHQKGFVRRGRNPYYDEIDSVGQKPFCRCNMIWLYNLRDLPDDMLTRDGKRALVEVGQHTNASRAFADDAVNDDVPRKNPNIPVPVDRDHDVPGLGAVHRNGDRLYVDRSIPRALTLLGKTIDPAEILWAREHARWRRALELHATFIDTYKRHPDAAEAREIYRLAGERARAAENEAAAFRKLEGAWQAWAQRTEASLSSRDLTHLAPYRFAA